MTKGYAIIDSAGQVIGTYKSGGARSPTHCPIEAPSGGMAIALEGDDLELVIELIKDGKTVLVVGSNLMVEGLSVGTIESRKLE